MEYRRFQSRLIVRIDKDEEIIEQVINLCQKENIQLAEIKALGALSEFEIGLFDVNTREYIKKNYHLMTEITGLWGTISTKDGEIYPHIHLNASDREHKVYGGHMSRAVVGATCEMVIEVMDGQVERAFDESIGLNLMKFL